MDEFTVIKVSDFFKIPGARHREDGDNSAQQFFEDAVKAVADKELLESQNGRLLIDLDNTVGYPSSFISELSKLMSDEYKNAPKIKKRIKIVSEEDPGLVESFWYGFKQNYSK
jgi:hypothetical protein